MNNILGSVLVTIALAAPAVLSGCAAMGISGPNGTSVDYTYGRMVDKTAQWQQIEAPLLTNFLNMYNLDIIEEPEDTVYPFKGWFFGWAANLCNAEEWGCDAIYAARASSLLGPWEVYSGRDGQGAPIWDATMTPQRWVSVLAGGQRNFHNIHNGDPSVVRRNGTYYMLYSASGVNKDGIGFGHPGDTDGDFTNVMAASSKDGLQWTKSGFPALMYTANWGERLRDAKPGEYVWHPLGGYARPSLRFEDGKFKVWFDAVVNGNFAMLYAENSGEFAEPNDWNIVRGMDDPAMESFPNPEVHKIENIYLAFGDPKYSEAAGDVFAARWITWAASLDGQNWKHLGHLRADEGWQANLVPEVFVQQDGENHVVYLNYGTMIHDGFFMDSIRMKRWVISPEELAQIKAYLAK